MAPRHRVTDFRNVADANGRFAPDLDGFGHWVASVVECITASGGDEEWLLVPLGCAACQPSSTRRSVGARALSGKIEWMCSMCHASGSITHWAGTPFDLRLAPEREGDETHLMLRTRLDEIEAVRKLVGAGAARLALARAVAQRDHVVFIIAARDLADLLETLRQGAAALDGAERLSCERFIGRADSALLGLERTPQTAVAHVH